MLPFASPLTTDAALGWSAAEVPRSVAQVALTTGWAAGLVAAAVVSGTRLCTPDNPAICAPDQGFAWSGSGLPRDSCAADLDAIAGRRANFGFGLPRPAGIAFALADTACDDRKSVV